MYYFLWVLRGWTRPVPPKRNVHMTSIAYATQLSRSEQHRKEDEQLGDQVGVGQQPALIRLVGATLHGSGPRPLGAGHQLVLRATAPLRPNLRQPRTGPSWRLATTTTT